MFIELNGTELFYEKSGTGTPIILLHGNGEDHSIFDIITIQLSKSYTVYAIDSRGHGNSSASNNIGYEIMTDDIVDFINKLDIVKPILYGFSDGGIIGILIASKYTELLSKLIVSGINTQPDGIKNNSMFYYKVLYFFTRDKKIKMIINEPNITENDLERITVPTLITAGSEDLVKYEHTEFIHKHIENSIMKIIDGENHHSYVKNSEKLYEIINPFLEESILE